MKTARKRYTKAELSKALDVAAEELDAKPELSQALDLINTYAEQFSNRAPLDPLDIGDAHGGGEAYQKALDRVSGVVIDSTGRLLALLNPYGPFTGKGAVEKRNNLATNYAELFHALGTMLREWRRFRRCEICPKLFLPRRRDQKCCSKLCAGLLRMRRYRAKQAEYEYNRKLKSAGVKPATGRNSDLLSGERAFVSPQTPSKKVARRQDMVNRRKR
jgi:hypothetical protein